MPQKQKQQNQLPAIPEVKELLVIDQQSLDAASTILVGLKRLRKEIENHYNGIIKPIDEALTSAKNERNSRLGELDSRITAVGNRIQGYIQAEEARRQEDTKILNREVAAIEEKQKTKEIKKLVKDGKVEEALALKDAPSTAIVEYVVPVQIGLDQVTTKKLLDFVVEDITKVPNEYFKPRELDTRKIRSAGHDGKTVNGIRFFRKPSLSVRA